MLWEDWVLEAGALPCDEDWLLADAGAVPWEDWVLEAGALPCDENWLLETGAVPWDDWVLDESGPVP